MHNQKNKRDQLSALKTSTENQMIASFRSLSAETPLSISFSLWRYFTKFRRTVTFFWPQIGSLFCFLSWINGRLTLLSR
ncbi:hypothetical protein PMAYCL1PPCAC_26312 [Pristionchus mayeri]|uniref:Uncharacterized protein n=1 Tax=Pristionchus mayeri TaxID=1317129 RepID=A0AAN5D4V6_9BILA|nr:hypothetical protein PMAYCL1PPCAC_26312 [Pristionchus mayeri]